MGLDIRLPIGLMFSITGLLLTVYGLFTRNSAIYEKSLGFNLNLAWGIIMLLFGIGMYIWAKILPTAPKAGPPAKHH